MLTINKRKISSTEFQQLKDHAPSFWEKLERFALILIVIVFILLMPFLWYDKHYPVAPTTELFILIPLLTMAVLLAFYIYSWIVKVEGPYPNVGPNLEVEEWHVKTSRAIYREDVEDFGPAFYVEVRYEGQIQWLFLWGQYFYGVLEEDRFPNSAFTIIRRTDNKQVLDIQLRGQYFPTEKTLPPFPKKAWRAGQCEEDGDLLLEIPSWSDKQ